MSRRPLIGAALRYGVAGLANTGIGYAVILLLDLGVRANPFVANAAGYAVGLAVSFVLSRGFVFRSDQPTRRTGPRYVVAAAVCFALNQAVMTGSRAVLPPVPWGHAASQLAGMASYTLALFAVSYLWVFRPRRIA